MAFTVDQALASLRTALDGGRLGHAYLVTGSAGAGKEELARRVAAMLKGRAAAPVAGLFGDEPPGDADVAETLEDAASELVHLVRPVSKSRRITVNEIHALEKKLRVSCGSEETKIAIVAEADRMGVESSNAFLKTLEEPPAKSLILLLTSRSELLLDTILSRCIQIELIGGRPLEPSETDPEARLLEGVGKALVAERATVRDALLAARLTQEVLAERKAKIETFHQTAFKQEEKRLKNATDAGAYLEKREKQVAARIQSDYLKVRESVIQMLIALLGDAVRAKAGGLRRALPRYSSVTAKLADSHSLAELELRMQAVERLGELANTNVQETLAFEASFLDILGVAK